MSQRLPSLLPLLAVLWTAGCGPVARRDLGSIPQRQITYDDLCHLQDYFDQRAAARATPFRTLDEQSTETSRTEPDEHGRMQNVVVGEGTYQVRDRSDRLRLRQLLEDEYRRLPRLGMTRREAEVRVHASWWRSGTIRRLMPDSTVVVQVDDHRYELPFNPCVGEFLFGDDAYAMRRRVLAADQQRARGEIPRAYLPADGDAGAEAGLPSDAGEAR